MASLRAAPIRAARRCPCCTDLQLKHRLSAADAAAADGVGGEPQTIQELAAYADRYRRIFNDALDHANTVERQLQIIEIVRQGIRSLQPPEGRAA